MIKKPISLLLVEDSEDDATLLVLALEKDGFAVTWERVETKASMIDACRAKTWDLVLADYRLPRFSAPAALETLKELSLDIPFIVVSGTIGEDVAIAAMKAGASDYLMKDNLVRLAPAVDRELIEAKRRKQTRETEKGLRRAEERFRLILDQVRDYAIITIDPTGTIIDWNPGAESFIGYTSAEIIGKNFELLFTEEDRAQRLPARELEKARREGRAEDIRWHVRKNGERFWAVGFNTALYNDNNELYGFSKIFRDWTWEKLREEADAFLIETTKVLGVSLDYQKNLNSLCDAIVPAFAEVCIIDLLDKDNVGQCLAIRHVDAGKQALLQQLRNSMTISQNPDHLVTKVIHSGQSLLVPKLLPEVVAAWPRTAENLHAMIESKFRSLIIVPIVAYSKVIGAMTLGMDSDQRSFRPANLATAEELARRAGLAIDNARLYQEARELNRLKDEFLATLSHELRTPLNVIVGHAQLLKSEDLSMEDIRESLDAIDRNARLQAQLVNDILDVSKIISGKLALVYQDVDLCALVATSLESIRLAVESNQLQLETQFSENVPTVKGDSDRIQQVIWNLLSNAIKFTPRGGKIVVTVAEVKDKRVAVSVKDSGVGINKDFLPFIFERFSQQDGTTTRKYGGLGLGLSISKNLVEMHGGKIMAASDGPGEGATFSVMFPIAEGPKSLAPIPSDSGQKADSRLAPATEEVLDTSVLGRKLQGISVLVVDDQPDALSLVARALRMASIDVITARSAAEALEAVHAKLPRILLCDIAMPEEDGYSLLRKIRGLEAQGGPHIVAAALTAFAHKDDTKRILESGFLFHVTKPLTVKKLYSTIHDLADALKEKHP